MESTVRCVGCGAVVPATDGPTHRYMLSAPACWAAYGELTAVLLGDAAAAPHRQWCVDAFAVQHPGEPNAQAIQSVAAHLLSLYVTLELKAPPAASHRVINRVTARKGDYRWLTPPDKFTVTVRETCSSIALNCATLPIDGHARRGRRGARITTRLSRGTPCCSSKYPSRPRISRDPPGASGNRSVASISPHDFAPQRRRVDAAFGRTVHPCNGRLLPVRLKAHSPDRREAIVG